MQFTKVCDLDVVPDLHLEFNDKGKGGCGDGAVINMYNNNDEGLLAPFDEDSLVNFTQLESEILDEDLDQFLVPLMAALFESVESFAQMANVAWKDRIGIAGWLVHVDSFFVV